MRKIVIGLLAVIAFTACDGFLRFAAPDNVGDFKYVELHNSKFYAKVEATFGSHGMENRFHYVFQGTFKSEVLNLMDWVFIFVVIEDHVGIEFIEFPVWDSTQHWSKASWLYYDTRDTNWSARIQNVETGERHTFRPPK